MASDTSGYLADVLEHLKQVVGHMPSAVYVCEAPSGIIRLYNARAVEVWGREPRLGDSNERFCGSFRLLDPGGRPLHPAHTPMADVLRDGGVRNAEVVMERPDGSRVPVAIHIAALHGPHGEIAGAINVFNDITERKRLEDELRLTAERYRALTEDNPDLVCRFLADGTLTFANDAYCQYFGRRRADVIGTRYTPLVHPDDLPAVEAALASLTPDHRVTVIENRVTRHDGAVRRMEWTNHSTYDGRGRRVDFEAAGRDITDRRQAEASAARLSAIVTSADDAIISKTLDGTVMSWNRAAEKMFGYSEAEMVGRSILTIIPAERHHEEAEILARLKRGEAIEHFETERLHRDGGLVAISLTVSPVKTSDGHVIGASKIARDVTEQKRAEAAVRRSEYELSDFFDNAVFGLHWVSADGTILRANKAELTMLGYAPDEYIGQPIAKFHVDAPVIEQILKRLCALETIENEPARLRCKDGSIREVLISSNVLQEDGRFVHTRCITRDVTDMRRLEREREELLAREQRAWAEAEAANQAKNEFLAMLAHELRNPLSVIVNAVSVIDGAGDLPERATQPVVVIQRQAQHLSRLLDDLLDVARITSGRIELDHARVDLRRAVELAAEAQQHRMDGKRQRVAISLPEAPVTILGDLVRMQQVVGNLLNNASNYTPAGGSIRLTLGAEGDDAVLRVADTGRGIPPDRLTAIFDLFVQANPTLARSEGGLGIGLTLVKRLVELHGGSVVAHSEGLGRGAEVVVRLPLAAAARETAAPPSAPVRAPCRRILVIEDNDDGREMLVTMLRVSGHEVLAAASGTEGMAIAAGTRPEVVLLDIGLPDINGYDLGRQLREMLGDTVMIAALTGYGQPQDRARSAAAGFNAHLVKPVDPTTLAETLQKSI